MIGVPETLQKMLSIFVYIDCCLNQLRLLGLYMTGLTFICRVLDRILIPIADVEYGKEKKLEDCR